MTYLPGFTYHIHSYPTTKKKHYTKNTRSQMISTTGSCFQPFFIFHNLWDVILPIDELILYIFFKMLIAPPTRWIPSGKLFQKTMENHHFQWVNPLKKPGTLTVGEKSIPSKKQIPGLSLHRASACGAPVGWDRSGH